MEEAAITHRTVHLASQKRSAGFQSDRRREPAKNLALTAARQNLAPLPSDKAFFFYGRRSDLGMLSILREPAMDTLTISAASGMRARMESLDMLANNMANADTNGYKTDREFYNLYVSPEAEAAEGSPATLPVIERPWTDFSQGSLRPTGSPLDLALTGKGLLRRGRALRQPLYAQWKLPRLGRRAAGYRGRIPGAGGGRREVAARAIAGGRSIRRRDR